MEDVYFLKNHIVAMCALFTAVTLPAPRVKMCILIWVLHVPPNFSLTKTFLFGSRMFRFS